MIKGATHTDWQHFDLMLGLTADLLPVVSDPTIPISPMSKMVALGKTPSRINRNGHAAGITDWTSHTTTPQEIASWARDSRLGICIQTRHLRALDIDVPDVGQADAIESLIEMMFGSFPVRYRSNSGNRLLAFYLDGELGKRTMKVDGGIIEALMTGRQFIAIGTHPSGMRYEWRGGLPSDFPTLTLDQFNEIWSLLEETFAIETSHESGAPISRVRTKDEFHEDWVSKYLRKSKWFRGDDTDGRVNVYCPWKATHSGDSGESESVWFPAGSNNIEIGAYRCLHASCAKRNQGEFLLATGAGADGFEDLGPPEVVTNASWPTPDDPFIDNVAPAFPLECLPKAIQDFAKENAAASGFDPGAYAFCGLVATSGVADQRAQLNLSADYAVRPILWGGLVDASGGGKSAVLEASARPVKNISDELERKSRLDLANWNARNQVRVASQPPDSKPAWRQRVVLDMTVEGASSLLADNPQGLIVVADELTEFIGRMDAYGDKGGGKDRSVYLRAYDGGSQSINRAGGKNTHIDNFSVALVSGVQPQKLASLFAKDGGSVDGLYQRFIFYAMRPAGKVDYSRSVSAQTNQEYEELFQQLQRWAESDTLIADKFTLAKEASVEMQKYHNAMRDLAKNTPGGRLSEHLNKFPGFLGRITFNLHLLECAEAGQLVCEVSTATFRRAQTIARALYQHSEVVYQILDNGQATVTSLFKSAAEAILAKGWTLVRWGDLTRDATGWKAADERYRNSAIDLLIDFSWLRDSTLARMPGQRGRPSDGKFTVNPAVHERFSGQATRIKEGRQIRYAAIQIAAGERRCVN